MHHVAYTLCPKNVPHLPCNNRDIHERDIDEQFSYWQFSTEIQQQPFYSPLSGTTRVSRYQKKHSPTHHPDHHPIFISPSIHHDPQQPTCPNHVPGNPRAQPPSMSPLVHLLVRSPLPHTPPHPTSALTSQHMPDRNITEKLSNQKVLYFLTSPN